MKELLDEKILLEMLKEFKKVEQAAKESSQISTEIAWKYQKKVFQLKLHQAGSDTTEQTSLT